MALTDREILDLEKQGYKEGDLVPGSGILTPGGEFRDPTDKNLGSNTYSAYTGGLSTPPNLNSLTEDQARGMFGSDFTGVIRNADGTYRADQTALDRINKPATANLFGQVGSALNPYSSTQSTTDARLAEITTEEQSRAAAARKVISLKAAQLRGEEVQRGVADVASKTGQLGRVGGSGDVRFSSAAIGFIDAAREASRKRLAQLDSEESIALAKLDVDSADRIREQRDKERDRLDKLDQNRFERVMKYLEFGLSTDKFTQDKLNAESDRIMKEEKLDLDTIDAISKIPEGKNVIINGRTYTGLGSDKDSQLVKEDVVENGQRVSKVFIIDRRTSKILAQNTLGQSAVGLNTTIRNTAGASYSSRLSQEVSNIYAGRYGQGNDAVTTAVTILKGEFPGINVDSDIKSRVPNPEGGFRRDTASSISSQSMADLQSDISAGYGLNELYSAYPDITPSLIQSLYYNQ